MQPTDAPILKITLPDEVYMYSKNSFLSDVRVFNIEGEMVPHSIVPIKPKREQDSFNQNLSFFPVYDNRDPSHSKYFLFGTYVDGTSVYTATHKRPPQAVVSSYIIDLSKTKIKPRVLTLDVELSNNVEYNQAVNVQESSDLSNWNTIIYKTVLTKPNPNQKATKKNTIQLPRFTKKYLKINWPSSLGSMAIRSISASTTKYKSTEIYLKKSIQATPPISKDNPNPTLSFSTNGYWPSKTINLEFPQIDSAIKTQIYYRNTQDSMWVYHSENEFYRMIEDGDEIKNTPVDTKGVSPRFWGFKPQNGSFDPSNLPVLTMDWQPNELYLLASGTQPFSIAIGARQPSPTITSNAFLKYLEDENNADVAIPSQLKTHPAPQPKEIPPEPFSVGKILMWFVLLVGIGISIYMVIRHINGLKATPPEDDQE